MNFVSIRGPSERLAWYFEEMLIIEYLIGHHNDSISGNSLGMRLANERRRYNVTTSLIGWAYT